MHSIITNNIELYHIKILPYIINIFFGLNRQNYARWAVLFLAKLKQMPSECLDLLAKGAFSIRRTNKNFSRSSVDLTLEQTVNKCAASPAKGLVHLRNTHEHLRKWAISTNQRNLAV